MAKYIDKSALVAEIEGRLKALNRDRDFNYLQIKELETLLSFIDTIEAKEVDLEEECKTYLKNNFTSKEAPDEFLTTQMQLDDMVLFAKHFYDLGLAQKGEQL